MNKLARFCSFTVLSAAYLSGCSGNSGGPPYVSDKYRGEAVTVQASRLYFADCSPPAEEAAAPLAIAGLVVPIVAEFAVGALMDALQSEAEEQTVLSAATASTSLKDRACLVVVRGVFGTQAGAFDAYPKYVADRFQAVNLVTPPSFYALVHYRVIPGSAKSDIRLELQPISVYKGASAFSNSSSSRIHDALLIAISSTPIRTTSKTKSEDVKSSETILVVPFDLGSLEVAKNYEIPLLPKQVSGPLPWLKGESRDVDITVIVYETRDPNNFAKLIFNAVNSNKSKIIEFLSGLAKADETQSMKK